MEPCKIETRKIPGVPYMGEWCVEHDDNPHTWDRDVDGWVCQTYIIGKRKESRPQDAALRALEALSEALEEERGTHCYEGDYALVDSPLRAMKDAVDRAIQELKKEV
jgi:hypothetical protein